MAKAPGKAHREGITVMELADMFPDEKAATEWFEHYIWPDGRHCPRCGNTETAEAAPSKKQPYWCGACRKGFSVRIGTAFERSKVSLRQWVFAIYLEMTSLKGVSSMKLHRDIGVTQKTAWFMLHRIREAWAVESEALFTGPVEADETYVGGARKNMSNAKRKAMKGTGPAAGKAVVVGADELCVSDIRALRGDDVPDIDLATASFPCVDLSLAGNRRGLDGEQSGLVRDFLRIMEEMDSRAPDTVMIENVPGFLTANGGRDWDTVVGGLRSLGYSTDHVIVDASAFVAQSRARVFLIGNRDDVSLPEAPPVRDDLRLAEVAEETAEWWPPARLAKFLLSLSPVQEERVSAYQARAETGFFGAFRRTRNGSAVWEVRADERAGALRTTCGGSSKQAILRAGHGCLAARWMHVMEYARLQGAGHLRYDGVTPQQAMFALGDAVCVPVVEWLARTCLVPLMRQ